MSFSLRKFELKDYEELVGMYYDFIVEIYPNRKISNKFFFYQVISSWITTKDIIICLKDDIIVGFNSNYIDSNGGTTEPVYVGECVFVKKKYRKSRAFHMLLDNGVSYARENGMNPVCQAYAGGGVDKMLRKKFKLSKTFVMLEGNKDDN